MVQVRVEYLNGDGDKCYETFYVRVDELISMIEYVYDNDAPAYQLINEWVLDELEDSCQEIVSIQYDWSPHGIY
jgi:hypothetical protein